MPTPPFRRLATASLTLLMTCALFLSGCSAMTPSHTDSAGVALSAAQLVDNPKDYEGPSTARLTTAVLNPVAQEPEPALPVQVTDAQGSNVSITDVSRILPIDLYGTSSRIVFDLGLGKNVVGRDTSSDFAEIKDLPLVTHDGHQLNAEAILQLAPTVIITDSSLGPWDVVLQMRDAGIPVFVVDSHRSLENAGEMITQIATALGVTEQGTKLAERTASEVSTISAQIKDIAPSGNDRLRMLFLYARGQAGVYYLFGEGSGADSLITSLGGVDIATEIGWRGMRPMTDEALIEAKPDLIIMMSSGLESAGGIDGILDSVPALALTAAGTKRRIVDMSDSDVLSFGPNSAAVLEALSVAIYAPAAAAK
ncbi:heme/hemin ABC transporter substrate-binding protein [Arthrobacter psychrolactophilus]|nr:ABC transporter substrate-binding protein [Arthrobacter psychrolactophilus]